MRVAVIPARAGSKRIPGKNVRMLGSRPLVGHTIAAAMAARSLDLVVVSTDDAEVARLGAEAGVTVIYPRPEHLASDTASSVDVLRHAVELVERERRPVEAIVLLQPTSPFRRGRRVDEALALLDEAGADTVTSVRAVKDHPYHALRPVEGRLCPVYPEHYATARKQDLPPMCIENGAVYVTGRRTLEERGLYGDRVVPLWLDEIESVDIDEAADLEWAEYLLARHPELVEPA